MIVIGILIALQINNWNEHQKSLEKTQSILFQVHEELGRNIESSNGVIDYYRGDNGYVHDILNKKVTREDYLSDILYTAVLQGYVIADLEDAAFTNFKTSTEDMNGGGDSLFLKLTTLYKDRKTEVDETEEHVSSLCLEFLKEMRDTKIWYGDYIEKERLSEEALEYFFSDPIYYNKVVHYNRISLGEHLTEVINFRNEALSIYKELSLLLEVPMDEAIVYDLSEFEFLSGQYGLQNDSTLVVHIKRDIDFFVLEAKVKGSDEVIQSFRIYPDSKSTSTAGPVFGEVIFDENQEITGFVIAKGSLRHELYKVK